MVRKIRFSILVILAVLVFVEAERTSSTAMTMSTPTANSTKPMSFLPEKNSTESSAVEKNNSTTIARTAKTTESTNGTRAGTESELLPSEDKKTEASVLPATPKSSSSTIESTSRSATPATMNNATTMKIEGTTSAAPSIIPTTGSAIASESTAKPKSHSSTTVSPDSTVESPSVAPTETISQNSRSGINYSTTTLANPSRNATMPTFGLGSSTSSSLAGNHKTTEPPSGKSKNTTGLPNVTSTTQRAILIPSMESVSTSASPSSASKSPSNAPIETMGHHSSTGKDSSINTLGDSSNNSTSGLGSSTSLSLTGDHKETESRSGKSKNTTGLPNVTSTTQRAIVIPSMESVSTSASPSSASKSPSNAPIETMGHHSSTGKDSSINTSGNSSSNSTSGLGSSTSSSLTGDHKETESRSGKSKNTTGLPNVTSATRRSIEVSSTEGVSTPASPISTVESPIETIGHDSRSGKNASITTLANSSNDSIMTTSGLVSSTSSSLAANPKTTGSRSGKSKDAADLPIVTSATRRPILVPSAESVSITEFTTRPVTLYNVIPELMVMSENEVIKATGAQDLTDSGPTTSPLASSTDTGLTTVNSTDSSTTMASSTNMRITTTTPTYTNATMPNSTSMRITTTSPSNTSVTTANPTDSSAAMASSPNMSITTTSVTYANATMTNSTNRNITMTSPSNTKLARANSTNSGATVASSINMRTTTTSPINMSIVTTSPTNTNATMGISTNTSITTTTPTNTSATMPNSTNMSITTTSPTNTNATMPNSTIMSDTTTRPTNTRITTTSPTNTNTTMSNPTNTTTTMSNPTNTNTTMSNPTNTNSTMSNPTNANTTMSNPTNTNTTMSDPTNTNTTMSNPTNTSLIIAPPTKTSSITNMPTTATANSTSISSTITEAPIIAVATETSNSLSTTLPPPNFDYVVVDPATGVPCILSTLSISMKILYEKADSTLGEGKLTVPKSARSNGTCNGETSHMELAWSASRQRTDNATSGCLNTLIFNFVKNGSTSTLDSIHFTVCLDEHNFPHAASNRLTVNTTKPLGLFSVAANSGHYVCDKVTNVTTGTIRVTIRNVSLIAFNKENNVSSKREENCVAKGGVNKAVVMGGMSVAIIVVSAASVYSWRRRSSSYDSSTLP